MKCIVDNEKWDEFETVLMAFAESNIETSKFWLAKYIHMDIIIDIYLGILNDN
jgi:hypothetical protein